MSIGKTYTKHEGTVWLKQHGTLDPFTWGGRCMRLEDIASNEGGLTTTTRANPRGGLERDSVLIGPPGETTSTITMKRSQFDTMKTELRTCLWDIDMRINCDGIDRDAPNSWEEISRICQAKVTTRTLTGSAFGEDDEEMMVALDLTGLESPDIYRLNGEEETSVASTSVQILDVTVAQPERCPSDCDPQEECIVYACTEGVTGSPSLSPSVLINESAGEAGQWSEVVLTTLAGGAGVDAESILGFGDFFVVSCNSESAIVYSDDQGTTQVEVTLATAPAASSHALDGTDLSYMFVGCDSGDIFQSTDGARTWTQVADNLDGGNSMDIVRIAKDNPFVIYAASNSSDEVQKTENGAVTWFQVATNVTNSGAGGNAITALYPISQNRVLVGSDAGEVIDSTDGGVTWTEQSNLPGMTTKGNVTVTDISGCSCGVLFLTTFETAVGSKLYVNYDGGADGRWYQLDNGGSSSGATVEWKAVACCGANKAVAVGGVADTSSSALVAG